MAQLKAELRATHTGVLDFDGVKIPCAVLENGLRVITVREVRTALGRTGTPRVFKLADLVGAKNLKPFRDRHLQGSSKELTFRLPNGQVARGVDARVLPRLCRVYTDALMAGVLRDNQLPIAKRCYEILSALADVSMYALVDEASGYQYERDATELQRLLPRFIRAELRPYAPIFPREVFQNLYRFLGYKWTDTTQHPKCMGALINWAFYGRMIEGLPAELQRRNPADENGQRRQRHHQYLSDDIGKPMLEQLIIGFLAIARTKNTWEAFKEEYDRAFPRQHKAPILLPTTTQPWLPGIDPEGAADE